MPKMFGHIVDRGPLSREQILSIQKKLAVQENKQEVQNVVFHRKMVKTIKCNHFTEAFMSCTQ